MVRIAIARKSTGSTEPIVLPSFISPLDSAYDTFSSLDSTISVRPRALSTASCSSCLSMDELMFTCANVSSHTSLTAMLITSSSMSGSSSLICSSITFLSIAGEANTYPYVSKSGISWDSSRTQMRYSADSISPFTVPVNSMSSNVTVSLSPIFTPFCSAYLSISQKPSLSHLSYSAPSISTKPEVCSLSVTVSAS